MRLSLVFSTLLCLATWMGSVCTTNGPVPSCCLQWSNTRVHLKRIVNYTIQSKGVCPVTAIVFKTEKGKRVCSDPNSDWAKRAMGKVDEEKRRMVEEVKREEGEANTRGPAVQKKAPKKGGGSANGPEPSCCLQWSNTRVHLKRIVNYTIQSKGVCPVTAIVFKTEKGKRICSDPNSDWAKRAMGKVDKEKRRMVEEVKREEGEANTRTI